MSDENRRLPGDLLLKVLEAVLTRRVLDNVAIPALADLQHESRLTRTAPAWRRPFVLLRGYLGIWTALVVCFASWPITSFREDWLANDASGPRLLRALTPRMGLVGSVLTLLLLVQSQWQWARFYPAGDAKILMLTLPSVVTVTLPIAFLLSLVLALSRLSVATSTPIAPTHWLGSVVGLSIASGLLTFVLCAWVTPQANQSYRERVFRLAGVPGLLPMPKGPRELTLGELWEQARHATKGAETTLPWEVEWHKKWAIPAASVLFGPFAIGLHGLSKRPRPGSSLALALAATYLLYVGLRVGENAALSGAIRPLPAIWAGDAALALAAACLIARLSRFRERAPAPA